MPNNISFICDNIKKDLSFDGRKTIFELLAMVDFGDFNGKLSFDFPCGGKKTCGKCKIKIINGFEFVSEPDETEKKYLTDKDIKENIRYACMCEVFGDVIIELNPDFFNKINKINIQTEGLKTKNITPDKYKRFIYNANINNIYGAAIDIGTTTVAVYLYDMTTGDCMGIATEENPQRAYGADVISRISYTIENEKENQGLINLKNLILSLIFKLIKNLCDENNIDSNNIYSMVLTGNTVMQHIAMGLPPKTIAFAPFTPVSLFGFDVTPAELAGNAAPGVPLINPDAIIYFPPAFASYVGGDIATGIIASDTDLCENLRLFIDIGTNGEIGLGNKDSLVFCATAAGPAFEGAHIKFGMAGIKGAINNIYLDELKENIIYETIGDIDPKGICGSGIIDAAALMLELGVIDETGRILDSDEFEEEIEKIEEMPEKYRKFGKFANNLREIDGENAFVLDINHNIYITQKDIREIQLAKAAVSAGIMTLLNHCGKNISDIDELILAGGFGAHINKKSACKIGLIPSELEDKIIIAGNTAGMGAVAVLLDSSAEERINKISAISEYIELSGDLFFMDEYVERMMF